MNATRIEWTHVFGQGSGHTWNPVVGCTNNCDYCYARRAAKRTAHLCKQYPTAEQVALHGLDPDLSLCGNYWPHLHEERLDQPLRRRKPAGIFVGSMTDLWDPHVPQEWRDRIWDVIAQTPEHLYWVLTKQPQNITDKDLTRWAPWEWDQLWVGVTVTCEEDLWRERELLYTFARPLFISFEPLLGEVPSFGPVRNEFGWIIIGAETGNRKRKIVPEAEWVEQIVERAKAANIPVFVKDNLAPVMGEHYVRLHQEWSEGMVWHGT